MVSVFGMLSLPRRIEPCEVWSVSPSSPVRTGMLSRLGVGGRLLLAFLGISGLAVVGAGVAIYSFREIGDALDRITARRVPAALDSQEVSRQAERIVAAAPALLSARTPTEQTERSRGIGIDMQALVAQLEGLEGRGADSVALGSMRSAASRLRVNLEALDKLVADRIIASEQKRTRLNSALAVHGELQSLLAPWVQIVEGEIEQSRSVVNHAARGSDERAAAASRLITATSSHQALQRLQLLFTSVNERLQQIALTDDIDSVRVLAFRIQQASGEARRMTVQLDARLQPLLTARLDESRAQFEGTGSIPGLRLQELVIGAQANRHLAENSVLSRDLTEAVDRLVSIAKRDIAQANRDALATQEFSSTVLIAAVALSLLSSILIVWLYVGRRIVRPLSSLRQGMLAIAGGNLGAPIEASGADEIAEMGRAVDVFRRSTLERDELLAEKAQAAERLEQQVKERTAELAETLEHQTATGYVLDVIGRSPTDVQPVFQRIADSAATLCEARFCNVFRFDGQLIHFAASHGLQPDEHRTIAGLYPVSPGRGSVAARAIQGRSVEEIPDIDVDPNYQHGPMIKGIGYRSIVGVPMLMGGQPIGAIVVSRTRAGYFPARQIQLLETFADQAVIAIKNVGLFDEVQARTRELSRSVAELKALGEVSQAVNSTIDLEMVLSTIVAKAVQLSDTEAGTIYVFDEASQEFRLHSTYGMDEALVAGMRDRPIRAGQGTIVDRATSQRTPLQLADVQSDTQSSLIVYDIIVRAGFRALLAIPLLARDRIVGALVVRRKKPGGFPKGAVEILQTFAEQSVLAIQNARLFNEAQEALAQQTTTSDILRVISGSPTDVTPVYNAVVEAAVRLLACDFALVLRTDGKTFSPVAGCHSGRPDGRHGAFRPARRSRPQFPVAGHRFQVRIASARLVHHRTPTPRAAHPRCVGLQLDAVSAARARQRVPGRAGLRPSQGASRIHGQGNRSGQFVPRPDHDRDREYAALQRDQGGAGTPDGDQRNPGCHLEFAGRHPAGLRRDCRERWAVVRCR